MPLFIYKYVIYNLLGVNQFIQIRSQRTKLWVLSKLSVCSKSKRYYIKEKNQMKKGRKIKDPMGYWGTDGRDKGHQLFVTI